MKTGYYDLKRPELLNLIPATAKSILDLGCGAGALGKALKERQPCHVSGIELNKEAAETAKKNLDTVWEDNLNRFDPRYLGKEFDCIVLGDILEHLIAPWAVLKKFATVLENTGTVIASVPNISHPWIISQLQKGLFRYEPAGILDITHLRFFTKTTISQMFYQAGLKITKISPWPNEQSPTQYHVTAVKPVVEHKTPVATILVLTHNAWEYTAQCLASIKAVTEIPYKILVIDNASTDGTVERLREDNSIYHIENSSNLGFATGFNTGLSLIDTPFFVICNSDIVVTKNWLKRMTEHLSERPNLMLLGPRSNFVSGPQLVKECTYNTESTLDAYAARFATTKDAPVSLFKRIVFFCTLFRREALLKVGFLDEIYEGGNYEDDDYCMRVFKKGFQCGIDNSVFIHHYGSQTFKDNKIDFTKSMTINGAKFLKKYGYTDMQQYFNHLRA